MDILNNIFSASFTINLMLQLLLVSSAGYVIMFCIQTRKAAFRSLVGISSMATLFILMGISLVTHSMAFSWNSPLVVINKEKGGQKITSTVLPSKQKSEIENSSEKNIGASSPLIGKTTFQITETSSESQTTFKSLFVKPFLINCFGMIWLCGFIIFMFRFIYLLAFLKGFKAATVTELDNKFKKILQEVKEAFKFQSTPKIFLSKAVSSPIAIGIKQVSVFIPEGLYKTLSEDEFRSILFHEFAHIYHKDHLLGILNSLILGLNWWNPLVYRINTEFNQAREEICDNYAIKGINSAEVYSSCLANLAEKVCLISNLPPTAGMAGKKSVFQQRIKSILNKERKMDFKTLKSTRFATLTAAFLGAFFISAIMVFAGPKRSLKDYALEKAVCFSVPSSKAQAILKKLATHTGGSKADFIKRNLGNNLSTAILTLPNISKHFECYRFSKSHANIAMAISNAIKSNGFKGVVTFKKLNNVKWKETEKNEAHGSFTFVIGEALKGKCLFEAEMKEGKWIISKLNIARKNNNDINEGYPVINNTTENSYEKINQSKQHLKQIVFMLKIYAVNHNDYYPDSDGAKGFEKLKIFLKSNNIVKGKRYLENFKLNSIVFTCPTKKMEPAGENAQLTEKNVGYVYFGGFSDNASHKNALLAFTKPVRGMNSVNILFGDGRVKEYKGNFPTCVSVIQTLKIEINSPDLFKTLMNKAKQFDENLNL